MKTAINRKVFFMLLAAALLSILAILPYSLALQGSTLQQLQQPIPLPAILAIQVVQNGIMFAIAILGGLFFAQRVGLTTPILEKLTQRESVSSNIRAILPMSISIGIVGTILLLGLEFFYFQPALAQQLGDSANPLNLQTSQPAAWKGLLASFYGGIAEEILLRLFIMSFFVWLGRFISKTPNGQPTHLVFWTANILAAVLFGLGHLPATSLLVPLTTLVIIRAIVLNGILGIAFGWLYWKHGLESAMISHFSADIVLHVLLAL